LCSLEIAHYRAQTGAEAISFVDAADGASDLGDDLDQGKALVRFHVRQADGQLVSGVAAFVAIWRLLPRWKRAARIGSLPGVIPLLEVAYRAFLMVRPVVAFTADAVVRSLHARRGNRL
jgi:predicted DCC family thiol-disulfide oxidoreductase YuxK